jgi:hypothetical protein
MPKSHRKKMTPELRAALQEQIEAFHKKFGRDPGPGDPILFDPDADVPTPISRDRIERDLEEAARKAGLDPVVVKKLVIR